MEQKPSRQNWDQKRNRTKLSGLGAIAFWAFEIFSYGNSRRTKLGLHKGITLLQIGRLDGQRRGGDSGQS